MRPLQLLLFTLLVFAPPALAQVRSEAAGSRRRRGPRCVHQGAGRARRRGDCRAAGDDRRRGPVHAGVAGGPGHGQGAGLRLLRARVRGAGPVVGPADPGRVRSRAADRLRRDGRGRGAGSGRRPGHAGSGSGAGVADAGRPRQRVPHAADAARRERDRGIRQPARGARRIARSEPHHHGRRRDPRSVPAVRADERVQPRDHPAASSSPPAASARSTAIACRRCCWSRTATAPAPSGSPAPRPSASPTPTSCSKAGCPAAPPVRGWSPAGAPTTTWSPSGSPTTSSRVSPTCRPRRCGSRPPAGA